jgi:mannose-1-phosphate guanylyltransferase
LNSGLDDQPYIAIISGGVGTRLWPRSRRRSPKQLINLAGGRSLIQNTLDRVSPLTSPERTFVITIGDQQDAVRAQLPDIPPANIIAEPEGRNTAMAIGLAIAHIAAADPNALMISVGSDHFIGDDEAYRATLRAAVAAAADGKHLVTVGITPTSADTGYGYIRRGEVIGAHAGVEICKVLEFKEKPALDVARRYFESGDYLWNGNYFIWRVSAALVAYAEFAPDIGAEIDSVVAAIGTDRYPTVLAETYGRVRKTPIDTAIIEKATNVLTVPGHFPWVDVGTWSGAYEIASPQNGNFRTGSTHGKVLFVDSTGCLVDSGDRTVALVGLKDVVVIDTEDALLVCNRSEAQLVGDVVNRLAEEGLERLL